MFERTVRVVGEEKMVRIQHSNILIVGVGGVGGYVLEALVRSGVLSITISDFDVIEESNLNRQIIAIKDNIGKKKVEEAKKRLESISPTCNIHCISKKLDWEFCESFDFSIYDYVIDACDDVLVKVALIHFCHLQRVPIISCMGTGNRVHPELLEISQLNQTMNDPLAKRVRSTLRKIDVNDLNVSVVWSREIPVSAVPIGTICPVPMAAGSFLASHVLNELCDI